MEKTHFGLSTQSADDFEKKFKHNFDKFMEYEYNLVWNTFLGVKGCVTSSKTKNLQICLGKEFTPLARYSKARKKEWSSYLSEYKQCYKVCRIDDDECIKECYEMSIENSRKRLNDIRKTII